MSRKKQPNSQMCFACGLENPVGLKLPFYEEADGRVTTAYAPADHFQGYPGVLHGGIVTALLDETLGRVAIAQGEFMVTARLNVRFRKPVPLGQRLLVEGRATGRRRGILSVEGRVLLEDGTVLAEATATFMPLPPETQEAMVEALAFWEVVPDED
ncbi:MAG: PaaI family thioesterase [Anaerolineae bacterium]